MFVQVHLGLVGKTLRGHWWFRKLSTTQLGPICAITQTVFSAPGDALFYADDPADSMYFVADGVLVLLDVRGLLKVKTGSS